MKNNHIFLSKVFHFQYDQRFLFSREMGNIRAYKDLRLSIKNRLARAFPFHLLQYVVTETSNNYYLVLCHFLMS